MVNPLLQEKVDFFFDGHFLKNYGLIKKKTMPAVAGKNFFRGCSIFNTFGAKIVEIPGIS